ncbi:NAD(P)-binding protein [Trichoderma citrinoviride]|uniref:NAD(P)-binding protein n=1 Tax=Trichoderma citrinoviride TaxID=58853 RepID=A0A2T4BBW6_9HYPO|nr:NAD(P)-binding protein [Trichoderma citrinoviride]PTB66820.1 NAD(P)-binding protein [Trichoderma citrinoviride]
MSFPTATATYHHEPTPAVDPTQEHLSVAGKTVLVTGGGTTIGAATVEAFAKAKADHIFLIGRRLNLLKEVEQRTDLSKEDQVKDLFRQINKVSFLDILVANAGYLPTPGPLASSETSEWWKGYEINALGTYLLAKYFLNQSQPVRGKPVFIGVNTGAAHMGPAAGPMSGYVSSKLATASVVEFLQAENPNIKAFNVSPGIVKSEMADKANLMPPQDSPELMANMAVWLAGPESDFLSGRFLWANWDVEELVAAKDKIEANPGALHLTLEGWWSNFASLK